MILWNLQQNGSLTDPCEVKYNIKRDKTFAQFFVILLCTKLIDCIENPYMCPVLLWYKVSYCSNILFVGYLVKGKSLYFIGNIRDDALDDSPLATCVVDNGTYLQ